MLKLNCSEEFYSEALEKIIGGKGSSKISLTISRMGNGKKQTSNSDHDSDADSFTLGI